MTCADCRKPLKYRGYGRPPERCEKCRTEYRRKYQREAKRRARA